MSRKLKTIQDIVAWNLCVGCGACASICNKDNAVKLVDTGSSGIRPQFNFGKCQDCTECLAVCPGYNIDAHNARDSDLCDCIDDLLIGSHQAAYEGHAMNSEIRFQGSSGGILTALAAWCLEQGGMDFVVHTGMDDYRPWKNKTVISKTRENLISHAGSRYCPSSPCELLHLIENNDKPCVFIGKPCDVAALNMARMIRPGLDANIGLVLSFFCAGTPCSDAVRDLAGELGIQAEKITSVRYRGQGWPGRFRVQTDKTATPVTMAYMDTWSKLSRRRPFRCHICPDGMGQLSDIVSGDAWNRYTGAGDNPGLSHVIARTAHGKKILEKASADGYINIQSIIPKDIVEAQGLVLRRTAVFGRLLAMKLCGVPTTNFRNFDLFKAWLRNNPLTMAASIAGTLKRMLTRGLWRKGSSFYR